MRQPETILPRIAILGSLLLLGAFPILAAVSGRVTNPNGEAVEGARVRLLESEGSGSESPSGPARRLAVTDREGRFSFPQATGPAQLLVEHPRFDPVVGVAHSDEEAVFVLSPRQEIFDEIVVSAGRERGAGVQPMSVAATTIAPEDLPAPPSTFVELIEGTPGVAENGQGGLFQAYSIRGVAGQRVQSLISGVRIVTERRAGATASFVDPLLLSGIDVVRGPYTSFYGSGALGGVAQALPARFRGPTVDAGWESQGDSFYARVGTGGESWSLGLAHRRAGNAETADGTELFSEFEQSSATLLKDFELGSGLEGELFVLPSIGRDIGKPNARYPERITRYPEENHLVTRFTVRRAGSWRLDLYAHPNELRTENLRSTSRETVDDEAFDFGLALQSELDLPRSWTAQVGLDYFGRRNVTATQRDEDFASGGVTESTTLDGSEDEAAVFGSLRRGFGRLDLEVGTRFTWQGQDNSGAASTSDTAWSGFAGATMPLGGGVEMVLNVGSGLRFPGLSERYFTGATGRGEVLANPDLRPERSLTADLGVRWYGSRAFVAAYVFRNEIDDYIERIELADGVRSFANLTSGTIEGVEIEGFFQLSESFRLSWSGQAIEGRSDDDATLADIPQDRIELGGLWDRGPWRAAARWAHRFDKTDPGPGEQRMEAAEVVSASIGYRLHHGLRLTLSADNLLDESYLPSADDLSVPAQGRSVGLGIGWKL